MFASCNRAMGRFLCRLGVVGVTHFVGGMYLFSGGYLT